MKNKEQYNEYMQTVDNEQLKNAWNKMYQQMDLLYNQILTNGVKVGDTFNCDLFSQYYDVVYDIMMSEY